VAGTSLGAVRSTPGDLLEQARQVRDQLDSLGATATRIVVTSDLDEYAIASLASAPVDAYGVGTQLVTGSGAPTASMVYKLVSRSDDDGVMRPVEKRSASKTSVGRPQVGAAPARADGFAEAEVVGIEERPTDDGDDRPLMVDLVRRGELLAPPDLAGARERHAASRAELPADALRLQRGDVAIPTVFEDREMR
jgi:nicotinate phosphoribosyltransferase